MRADRFPGSAHLVRLLLIVVVAVGMALVAQPSPAKAYSNNGVPVIYVHGFNSNAAIPGGCNGSTNFGSIRDYLTRNGWTGPMYSVKYYNGDTSCDADLHALEGYHCTGWYAGHEGTTNEDLRHLSCLLAWYIWDHFTSSGVAVKLIGHSMGGILIRQTLADTPYVGAFPPYITVEDVATAGSPHQGMISASAFFYCGSCSQVAQIEQANSFMQWLNSTTIRGGFGRDPQGNTGTDWTTMSSFDDEVLAWCASVFDSFNGYISSHSNAIECGFMPGATHLVAYIGPTPDYNHGGYLTDEATTWDADMSYSDSNGQYWSTSVSMPHSIKTMMYAISYTSW
jgi:pimeloyl-ACP methyl ester carboxylesterase